MGSQDDMARFYDHAGLMVFGSKGRRLLTDQELSNYVSELFDTYTGGCVLIQEARMFFVSKGYTEDEAETILLLAEEKSMVRRGADEFEHYADRLHNIGAYEEQKQYLRTLGYSEEDGFVEVYAPPSSEEGQLL
ncbi:MAG: hypothetical protein QW767_05380 [Thermoprotei archaeon]